MKSRVLHLCVASTLAAAGVFGASSLAFGQSNEGSRSLTVVKTVSGDVPSGTTFTVTVTCDEEIIGKGQDKTDTATVEFGASGGSETVAFENGQSSDCTVEETADGGATTTTYSCESTVSDEEEETTSDVQATDKEEESDEICSAAGPQSDPITVTVGNHDDESATVTVANVFPEPVVPVTPVTPATPAPAAAVASGPRFTG